MKNTAYAFADLNCILKVGNLKETFFDNLEVKLFISPTQ